MPWQLTREQQRIALFEAPLMTSARAALKMIGLFAGLALALLAFGAAPAITILVGLGAYLAYRHFHVPPPNYRIVAACPPHPPRDLRGLDSWQTVVRDLGEQRDVVLDRFEAMLADRFSDASEPISIRRENIWYSGAEDKVELEKALQEVKDELRSVLSRVPLWQREAHSRQELLRLFLEDREQLGIDGIDRVDVVFRIVGVLARMDELGLGFGQFGEILQLGQAECAVLAVCTRERRSRERRRPGVG